MALVSYLRWRAEGLVHSVPGVPDNILCQIKYRQARGYSHKSVLSRGLTCGHHLGKESRRSLRGSPGVQMSAGPEAGSGARDTRVIARNSRSSRGRGAGGGITGGGPGSGQRSPHTRADAGKNMPPTIFRICRKTVDFDQSSFNSAVLPGRDGSFS